MVPCWDFIETPDTIEIIPNSNPNTGKIERNAIVKGIVLIASKSCLGLAGLIQ